VDFRLGLGALAGFNEDLAGWLDHVAAKIGEPEGRVVRDQLERAWANGPEPECASSRS
jgi:hypothetical protein